MNCKEVNNTNIKNRGLFLGFFLLKKIKIFEKTKNQKRKKITKKFFDDKRKVLKSLKTAKR